MLEYSFYTEIYGGKNIPEGDWKRVSLKAEQLLNSYTFGHLSGGWDGSELVKLISCAMCEMSELIYADEKRSGKASENNDGYSVSYETGKSLESSLYTVACVYLGDTWLMYAGVEEC